jgi:antitoxin component of MazEF toxin-antitoxin module
MFIPVWSKNMEKKLSKHGNSLALILDKPLLKLLAINKDTTLTIRIEGDEIILKPSRKKKTAIISDNPKKQKSYEKLVEKYAPALRKLAKN